MRRLFIILFFTLCRLMMAGQNETLMKGTVSYISSQQVYVKFETTENITIGDTLFSQKEGRLVPVLVIINKSSVSCVGVPVPPERLNIGDEIYHRKIEKEEEKKPLEEPPETRPEPAVKPKPSTPGLIADGFTEDIRGRFSVASYSNLSEVRTDHRMRYTFSMQGDYLGDSRFSTDIFATFRHTLDHWDEVRANIKNALKVYSFSASYDFSKTSALSLGRKINPKLSGMGAIDGVQYEKGIGDYYVGVVAGTRPDHLDYGFNIDLQQAGVYFGRHSTAKNDYQQTTLAIIEQRNRFKTDRRFVYFQHSGNLAKNLNAFGSLEVDLYERFNEQPKSTVSLTNLYASLRYRATKNLNFSAAYDTRKNVLYFETFKSYIDSLVENETRQGLRFDVNFRPFKWVTWGGGTSWRFQKDNGNLSRNLNSYLTFSRIPWLEATGVLSVNFLHTNYLDSKIFGVRFSKDIIPGKLDADIYYRFVDYQYKSSSLNIRQNIAGVSLSARITRQLGFYIYYEGTLDNRDKLYNRFNSKIVKRF